MNRREERNRNIRTLAICHFVAIVIMSFFGANVFELAERFAGTTGWLLLPTNRSIWEMSKMLVGPTAVIFTIEYFIVGRKFKNYIPVHLMIVTLLPIAMIGIMTLFQNVFGAMSMQGAQAVFFLALLMASFFLSIMLTSTSTDLSRILVPFLIVYIVICAAYVYFTFNPPRMRMFFDSAAETFGPIYK